MRKVLLLTLTCLACALHATIYVPSKVPNPKQGGQENYVSNPDAIIGDSDVVSLNRICSELKKESDVELAIVCLDSISDQYTMFDFGFELFQTWGIGVKGKNTGILITLCRSQRQVFFNTGTGIEGVMTDAQCFRIQQDYMVPLFREEDYAGGLIMGALRIYEICTEDVAKEELLNMQSVTERGGFYHPTKEDDGDIAAPDNIWEYLWKLLLCCIVVGLIAILFMLPICYQGKTQTTSQEYQQRLGCSAAASLVVGIVWALFFLKYILYMPSLLMIVAVYKVMRNYIRCPKCGRFCKQEYRSFTAVEPTEDSEGIQRHVYTCPHCGHKEGFNTNLPKVSSGGGGSGSGGGSYDSGGSWGGGSSSGGGAGSSW